MSGFWLCRNGERFRHYDRKGDAENNFYMYSLSAHLSGSSDEWKVEPDVGD